MRILLTHRYFWPDSPPYAGILRSVAEGLSAAGHEVGVVASRPSYRAAGAVPKAGRLAGIDISRIWVFRERKSAPVLRLVNVVLYCAGLFVRVLRRRPEIVTASSFPPVVAAWTASLAARLVRADFVYHVMDVHPELSRHSGGVLGRGLAFRLLRWLDDQTLARASRVVVLSRDQESTLRARGMRDVKIEIINNFLLETFDDRVAPPAGMRRRAGTRRVIFAGNLGRFQNLPRLAAGVATCFPRHPELELFFLGDGEAERALRQEWGDHPQVRFAPFLPFAQARELIAEAEVGLVALMPDIYRVSSPSKVLTYLGLGVPVLALVEPESALAQEIEASGLGVVPESATPDAIGAALGRLLENPPDRARIRDWYAKNADRSSAIAAWCRLIDAIGRQRAAETAGGGIG